MPTTSSMFTTCCVLFNAAIMKATIMEIFLPLWKFSRLFFYGGGGISQDWQEFLT